MSVFGQAKRRTGGSYTPSRISREPVIELSPALFLTTWASGLAAAAALVVWWEVAGRGFVLLAAAVTLSFGGLGWAVGNGWLNALGIGAVVLGLAAGSRPRLSAAGLAAGAVCFAAAAVPDGGLAGTLSGAILLGGVTAEMLLGHWFLIDPGLPRWSLKRLASIGAAGVVADAAVIVATGGGWDDPVVGWAFVLLGTTTLVLMVAVWFALNEPSYPGVMAATGLSYLAILTAIGMAVAGRALIDSGPGLLGADQLLGTLVRL